MALKVLMLRKTIDAYRTELSRLEDTAGTFETREAELAQAIEEAQTEDEQAAVEEAVEDFENEKAANEDALGTLREKIQQAEDEIAELEAKAAPPPAAAPPAAAPAANPTNEREVNRTMVTRNAAAMAGPVPYAYTTREAIRASLMQTRSTGPEDEYADARVHERADVCEFLQRAREIGQQSRASVKNAELTIPEVMLEIVREFISRYSKLIKYVNLKPVKGKARQNITGTAPEGVWTEMVARLNELEIRFNQVEVDGYKVGGYMGIPNSTLEDSDLNLATEILDALGQSIGYGVDKAICYGKGTKMPLGIVTRLAQTAEPGDYSSNAPEWKDLHTSNLIKIAASKDGADFFKEMILASGKINTQYARGEKVWVMKEETRCELLAKAITFNAQGVIVAQAEDKMPILGGTIEVLDFIPDGDILGGFGENYLLAEREGGQFASSDTTQFIEDNTLYKGTARYDGLPVISDAFVSINIKGKDPTTAIEFAHDKANEPESGGNG